MSDLTINADALRDEWLPALTEYVQDAQRTGQEVNLTKRPAMLTPAQVADRLNLSRSTISRKIKAGEIRTVRVGAHHRIPLSEFYAFHDRLMADVIEVDKDDLHADLDDR